MHFNIPRRGAVFGRNIMLRWVYILRETELIIKNNPPGPKKTARKPKNTARVSEAIVYSPGRSKNRASVTVNSNR